MRILVVDDNDAVRGGVIAMLSSATGLEICGEAKNASEALRKARELLPDLILLDISMPGINGLEAARHLRQEVPNAKILVMSEHDPIRLLPTALEAGAHACVDKGCLSTELLPTIEKVMGNSEGRGIASAG